MERTYEQNQIKNKNLGTSVDLFIYLLIKKVLIKGRGGPQGCLRVCIFLSINKINNWGSLVSVPTYLTNKVH
jgi:hypothetical protein